MLTGVHRLIIVSLFASTLSASPLRPVAATANDDRTLRLLSTGETCQIRLEVLSKSEELVFDSGWQEGNLYDWAPSLLPLDGDYRARVTTRGVDDALTATEIPLAVRAAAFHIDRDGSRVLTLLTHDATSGALVTTEGDLQFRFGDVFKREDLERMRLTRRGFLGIGTDHPQAPLDVNGMIRTTEGIQFADGTVLRTAAAAEARPAPLPQPSVAPGAWFRTTSAAALLAPPPRRARAASFTPARQFATSSTGVTIGVTNPDYKLDVAGPINTATRYDISGIPFLHNSGIFNAFVGQSAGNTATTGSFLMGIGFGALVSSSSGNYNTAGGAFALNANTTGSNNTAFGYQALASSSTTSDNTALGYGALYATTGTKNTAVGGNALNANSGGSYNTAVGYQALQSASFSSGADNSAFGYSSLYNNSSGNQNTAVGVLAMTVNTTGTANTALGFGALSANPAGLFNTALGYSALNSLSSGNDNIAIGSYAGSFVSSGSGNIYIGWSSAVSNYSEDNTIRIGHQKASAFISGIHGVLPAGSDVRAVMIDSNGQLGTTSSSRRFKHDIADMGDRTTDLMQLRPVTFRYNIHGTNAPLQYGLVAEEVAEIYPELVTRDANGEPDGVLYQFLAPMLLNEVQQQRKTIDTLQQRDAALEQRLAELEQLVAKFTQVK